MDQRLFQRLVRIFILDIFAHNADRDFGLRVVDAVDNLLPVLQIAILGFEPKVTKHQSVHALAGEHHRHLVNGGHIFSCDHGFFFYVAEKSDL